MNRKQLINNLDSLIDYYDKSIKWEELRTARIQRQKEIEEAILAGEKPPRKLPKQEQYINGEFNPEEPVIIDEPDLTRAERLSLEKKTLGVYFTGHPLDDYPGLINSYSITISDILNGQFQDNSVISLPVVISSITKKCSKSKNNYAVVILEDITGRIESTLFPKTWERLESQIREEQIVIATGRANKTETEDEEKSIVRFVLNKIQEPNLESVTLQQLSYRLLDGSIVKFIPSDRSNLSNWSRGKLYLKGI